MDIEKTITVCRFRDHVALHSTNAPTVYITRAQARALSHALWHCADDIADRDFQQGTFKTTTIDAQGATT